MGDDEDTGFDGGWDEAGDHGHAKADWILAQENFSHPDFEARDIDGRFTNRLTTAHLRDDLD